MNKDLRQEMAKIITPAWPSGSLLRADKISSLVYSHLEKKLPKEEPMLIKREYNLVATGRNLLLSEIKQILKNELK